MRTALPGQEDKAMRLTKFTDYAFRLLILAASQKDRHVTIEESARLYGISAPHLKKVVRTLTSKGFLIGKRGRSGGFRLAMPPEDINLGDVVRATEPDFGLVECFLPENQCGLTCVCKLPTVLNRALAAMLEVFHDHTLADIIVVKADLARLPLKAGDMTQPKRGPILEPDKHV